MGKPEQGITAARGKNLEAYERLEGNMSGCVSAEGGVGRAVGWGHTDELTRAGRGYK